MTIETAATAPSVTVRLHCEDGRWWAESDQVRFWSAAGNSRAEVEQLSREAMRISVHPDVTVIFLAPVA
jgi:hypothetical protein